MKDAVDIVKEIIFSDRFARICSLEVRQCLLREAARHLTRFAEVECVFCCLRLFAGKPTRKTLSVTIEVQISNVICHQGYLPSILCILIDADDQIVYQPNKVMIWTDTFANNKQSNIFSTELGENNARLAMLNRQDIRVIVGNPPYSVGQESANDDNQNDHYEELDARLAATYVQETASSNKNKLYDSYIRAYRWASDRIGNQGVIGFVTNAGWLDSSSADGMRKCMTEEFNSIYIYHLKGNARTQGIQRQKEKDNVFGEGSRAPVAIVFLVKNPKSSDYGKIYFHAVGDYLTREEKLAALKWDRSIAYTPMNVIVPDAHGDWFNQRDDSFSHFMRMDGKKTKEVAIFKDYSLGVNTNRDAWVYNSNRQTVINSTKRSVLAFNKALGELNSGLDTSSVRQKYIKDVAWSSSLVSRLERKIPSDFSERRIQKSLYRPFFKQNLYFDPESGFTHRPGRWKYIFPDSKAKNLAICSSGVGSKEYSCLMVDHIPCLDFLEKTQCFPRWLPGEQTKGAEDTLDFGEQSVMPSGFSPEALPHFQAAYPGKPITEDDLFYYIYGILHSEDYRMRYANNLMKELPRIPRVATYEQFMAFVEAGQELARLHMHFEDVAPYAGVKFEYTKVGQPSYRVTQMKWGKIKGKTGNAAKDKTTLIYNDWITVKNIPLEAQEYVVNKKSALDWVVERACVSIDKASGIVNDFNDYAAEMGSERYPLDLFLKVITVSLETMKIVKTLPKLEIHPLDK